MTLQRKWQTISYDSNEPVTGSNNIIRPSNRGPITISISDTMLTNIGKYRNKYNQYLKMTGVKLNKRFNPLQLVDRLVRTIYRGDPRSEVGLHIVMTSARDYSR